MNPNKLPIAVQELYLEIDEAYDTLRLEQFFQQNKLPESKFFNIMATSEYDYGEYTARLTMHCYRWETDAEQMDRIEKEVATEEKKKIHLAKQKLINEEARKERERLAADPEYQHYLQLQKKFK